MKHRNTKTVLTVAAAGTMLFTGCDGSCPSAGAADKDTSEKSIIKPSEEGGTWMTNYELARSRAKVNNLPILLSFSGSDWCGWCIKLDREVFSQPAFKEWAKKNVILMNVDFPRGTPQSDEIRKQNNDLATRYQVDSFPTVVLVDADGKVIARTGYQVGGAENYIRQLEKLLKKP